MPAGIWHPASGIRSCRRALPALQTVILILLLVVSASADSYLTFTTPPGQEVLQKGDVRLEVNKKQVEPTEFFLVDTANRSRELLFHPAGRRQYVFLFDLIFAQPADVIAARKAVQSFLSAIPPEDLVSVFAITFEDGLISLCSPTTDRNAVLRGLNQIGKKKLDGVVRAADGNLYPSKFETRTRPVTLVPDDDFSRNLKDYHLGSKTKLEHREMMFQGLVDLAFLLGTTSGRKNILFFTPGFDTGGIALDLGLDRKRNPPGGVGQMGREPELPADRAFMPYEPEVLAGEGPGMRARQTGPEIVPDMFIGADGHVNILSPAGEKRGFCESLSSKTAGAYYRQPVDEAVVQKILASDNKFYVAGWRQTGEALKVLESVKVSAGERKVTAPDRWLTPKPYSEYKPLEKQAHLVEAIYTAKNASTPGVVFWADFLFEKDLRRIPCFVQVPGANILDTKSETANYQFYGFLFLADGSLQDSFSVAMKLDLSKASLARRLRNSGLKMWNMLTSGGQDATLRWVLVNGETGETVAGSGLVSIPGSSVTISSPFLPSTNFDWVVWPKPGELETRRGVQVRYPYMLGKDYFFPELLPVLPSRGGRQAVVYFKMYNLPGGTHPPLHFQLVSGGGEISPLAEFQLLQKPRELEHAGLEAFWRLTRLPDLPEGAYRLIVESTDVRREIKMELKNDAGSRMQDPK